MKNHFADLAGKTALVTGASSGLGIHFAKVLACHGVKVIAAGRKLAALEVTCAAIQQAGGDASPLVLDIGDAQAVEDALTGTALDIVVNNAGIAATEPAISIQPEEFDKIVDTNLNGAFRVAQVAARGMAQAGRSGTIINVASILGYRVAGNVSAYAASKAGLIQLTSALGLEWARHGIRVNALCPGYIETPINSDFFTSDAGRALIKRIPQRRLGQPSDLDGPLLLLASDAGSYMTGTAICADGGHLVTTI